MLNRRAPGQLLTDARGCFSLLQASFWPRAHKGRQEDINP